MSTALKTEVANLRTLQGSYDELATTQGEKLTDLALQVSKLAPAEYPCIEMTETTATIEPNKLYVWGEVDSLTITLAEPTDTSIMNEYKILFKSGSTATTLTFTDSEVSVSGRINVNTIVCGFIINKKAYLA